ncbi:hypothetical protein GIW41_02795 [Pseudomonas sp. PA-6-1D]|uniref:hypothetical protein n=1 Tax=Pseudomonas TaxID=286 RepID=UPI0007038728|nr:MULTISPECIES: hypothetical protein [Pseudomonas]KQM52170.1 hypothetical protein ASE80_26280 [Pseudomonas sp. Leaf15]MCF5142102.1 hypothetical protein [Pseudomonas sp. PA-6-3C]MCF5146864.1 hypothetical protein [Pseudomonas sp. PA-6-3F]MCF5159538.1 hypothetical protein [Pseudomonas sp. PA-6-2E]MCF5174175.1 hypothetical protein [Pseudomonas sp. PA-6-1D]
MTLSTHDFAQRLSGAFPFPCTILGNRQRRTWERLIGYIESATCTSEFNKAAAYAEGYAHALADSGQINISTDRDLLIIATVDAWRCARTYTNTSTNLSYPGKP